MSIVRLVGTIFLALDVIIFFGFLISLYKALQFRPRFIMETRPRRKILTLREAVFKERWTSIMSKVDSESLESMKLAVIELDKLVDDALIRLGLKGQHMADRIEQLNEDEYFTLSRLWKAHRVRNDVVHHPDFELTSKEAQHTIEDYKAFLEELEVL